MKIVLPGSAREGDSSLVYTGPLTGIVSEGDDIGTLVLTLATEGAGGGNVAYQLVDNPGDLFELDSVSGELKTARAIDRESVALTGFLSATIRATSQPNGQSIEQVLTIVVQDVNDEPPQFSQSEYYALIHENLPSGTPLGGLSIVATDRDSVYSLFPTSIHLIYVIRFQFNFLKSNFSSFLRI